MGFKPRSTIDEALAGRVRVALGPEGVVEKRMFGGLCFLVQGHMACGIVGDELMVRVGPDGYADALAQPHTRPMDFTGKPLRGFVYVGAPGIAADDGVRPWVARGVAFARAQPPR